MMGDFEEDAELNRLRRDKSLNKSEKRRLKLEHIHKTYGHLLDLPANCLPVEHKASLGGGLRCFSLSYKRDQAGNKIKIDDKYKRQRCGNPVVKGSFYCKKHKGGNNNALIHGKSRNPIVSMYRTTHDIEFADLLEVYLNDEIILDIKPELASLRVALQQYMKKLVDAKPQNLKEWLGRVEKLVTDEAMNKHEKFTALYAHFNSVDSMTNGNSLDRLARLVDTVSKVILRLQTAANQEQYILTPDGLKMFLRAIVDIVNNTIDDTETKTKVKNALAEVRLATKGNIGNYGGYKRDSIKDAKFIVEENK